MTAASVTPQSPQSAKKPNKVKSAVTAVFSAGIFVLGLFTRSQE